MSEELRIGVIGATGAVGTVTLSLLAERGFGDVRVFASSRSAGKKVAYGDGELVVEEATPEALGGGGLDLCFFSVGTDASRALVPPTAAGGAVAIDKSDAFRLADGIPLVVAGVNDAVLNGHEIIANPNCSAIQLSCVLKPLHDAAGLAGVRLATYQSMSGAGGASMDRLRATEPGEADLAMDWELEGDEFTEESKLRAETRKILSLPSLPIQATCIRVPVLVGHGQAIWVETEEPLSPEEASDVLGAAPHVRLAEFLTAKDAVGQDEVLVARIRPDMTDGRGLALWSVNDNLRKGAALNAVQIAESLLERRLLPA
jgi:aspartate-semialdehyde dehydrogenase